MVTFWQEIVTGASSLLTPDPARGIDAVDRDGWSAVSAGASRMTINNITINSIINIEYQVAIITSH